jgi:hypothetical protein
MKKLTVFSVIKRIAMLETFLLLSQGYFNSLVVSSFGESAETNVSMDFRSQLNGLVGKVEYYVSESDTSDTYHYRAAPVAGGYQQRVPLIQNIFALRQNQISPTILFDTLERAIADYRDDLPYAWIRTFNPFYWISVAIHALVVLPFKLLTSSGFDGDSAQHSYVGKIIMLILNAALYLITILSGTATILGSLNKLDWAITLMKSFGVQ